MTEALASWGKRTKCSALGSPLRAAWKRATLPVQHFDSACNSLMSLSHWVIEQCLMTFAFTNFVNKTPHVTWFPNPIHHPHALLAWPLQPSVRTSQWQPGQSEGQYPSIPCSKAVEWLWWCVVGCWWREARSISNGAKLHPLCNALKKRCVTWCKIALHSTKLLYPALY